MRVGVVTTSYPREAGDPAGGFVAGFARWLAEAGFVVEVVAAGPGAERVDGLPVTRVTGRGLFYEGGAPDALAAGGAWTRAAGFQLGLTAAVARRAGRWQGVVSHWVVPSALAVEAAWLARALRRRPHLAIAHSSDVWLLRRYSAGRAWLRWLARRAELVYSAPHLVIAGAVGRVVPMGVDVAELQGDRERGRARFGLGRTTALFLSRLVPVKGLPLLYSALPPALDLVVAGDGPMRAAWEWVAPPNVRFVGEVRGEARRDLMAAADFLVVPSVRLDDGREEGTPTVLREALAIGLPIVATRTGGAAELLCNEPSALLVKPEVAPLRAALREMTRAIERGAVPRHGEAKHGWQHVGPVLARSLLTARERFGGA